MKRREIILSKEDWSEKYDSDVWLFSRLQKGEVPSSPKYIKRMYDALVKMKQDNKTLRFREAVIETPRAPNNEDHNMSICLHNCLCIVAQVFGHAGNNIVEGKDEDLHFILEFEGGEDGRD